MEPKVAGGLGEMRFCVQAIERGLIVSRPILDTYAFDFVVGNSKTFRVQVKTTSKAGKWGRYKVMTSKGNKNKKSYSKECIDIFAIYLADIDTWYIIPIEFLETVTISIYPHKEGWHQQFYEAWHLLQRDDSVESPADREEVL
jgi:hypothetical protein